METRNLRKERIGVVFSNKMDKTVTVAVKWKEKHPIYGKFVINEKFHAPDERNDCISEIHGIMENASFEQNKERRVVK
jgi:small subunit ribosomal protein S17